MDFFNEKGMFSKLKTLISSLYGITLWTSALPSPIHVPKEWPTSAHDPSGLKTLIYPPAEAPLQGQNHPYLAVHSCMITPSSSPPSPPPPPPPPHLSSSSSSSSLSGNSPVAPPFQSLSHSLSFSSSSSSIMDDLIGTESGVYIKSNEFETFATTMEENQQGTGTKRSRRAMTTAKTKTKTKKYPPPIPLLARTGNLPGHMPWILTREYRDGRLILKEQRVKHHEYFEAHRGNNCLVLNLVSLDSKVRCCHAVRDQHKQEKEEEIELQYPIFAEEEAAKEREEITEKEEEEKGEKVEEAAKTKDAVHEKVVVVKEMPAASSVPKPCAEDKSKKCGDLRKCCAYSGKMTSDFSLPCNANANRNTVRSTDNSSGPHPVVTARPVTTAV